MAVLSGLLSLTFVPPAGAEALPTACDKVASPSGSDSASGSASAPLRTQAALVNALAPGQVGCLRAGTYAGGLRVGHGGNAGAPITLRSYPGERATITGRIYVPSGSNYVTFGELSIDGNYQSSEQLPSPTIDAGHITFEYDDVTNEHTGICFDLGSATWGYAESTVIAHDRIHDCGVVPSTNMQHGIYVADATNTQIVDNVIDDNTDRGIQLYPNSTGAVITGNVIANNGEGIIFSGEGAKSSSDNLVEHNVIVYSQIRSDVESWYPSGTPLGVGNVVRDNCVSSRGINTSSGGFSAQGNVTVATGELLASGEGGYSAAPGSACAAVLGGAASASGTGTGSGGSEAAPSGGAPTPTGTEASAPEPTPQPVATPPVTTTPQPPAPVATPPSTPAPAPTPAPVPPTRGWFPTGPHRHRATARIASRHESQPARRRRRRHG